MKKLLLVAFLSVLVPFFAQAATVADSIDWTPPTTFTDGSPLVPAVDLSGFNVYCDGSLVKNIPDPSATTTLLSGLVDTTVDGAHSCNLTAVGVSTLESGPSDSVAFQCLSGTCYDTAAVPSVAPAPPGGVVLTKKQ